MSKLQAGDKKMEEIFSRVIIRMSEEIMRDEVGPYYLDFSSYEFEKEIVRKRLRDPYFVVLWGLSSYNSYLQTRDEVYKERVLFCADWISQKLETTEGGCQVWRVRGETSVLLQALGVSLLVRAYNIIKEERYKVLVEESFLVFITSFHEGGMRDVVEKDFTYRGSGVSDKFYPLSYLLFVLFTLWDYYVFSKDHEVYEAWIMSKKSLMKQLPKYDIGFWSLVDLEKRGSRQHVSEKYEHSIHVAQLWALHAFSNETLFAQYAERFEVYRRSFWKRMKARMYRVFVGF